MQIELPEILANAQLRKSQRAKYLQIKITRSGELEVVVPKRTSLRAAQTFLLQHFAWVQEREHLLRKDVCEFLPATISLPALNAKWQVQYESITTRAFVREKADLLRVYCPRKLDAEIRDILLQWLKKKAKLELAGWLQGLSQHCNLPFKSLQIRGQKTRWGSCSKEGDICLNYKLLFLPRAWVEYVMIHELCHTVHFDHSPQFWQLVSVYVQDWKTLRPAVKMAYQQIPAWVN